MARVSITAPDTGWATAMSSTHLPRHTFPHFHISRHEILLGDCPATSSGYGPGKWATVTPAVTNENYHS